jgi:hypothetical protein
VSDFWRLLNTPMRDDWRALALLVILLAAASGAYWALRLRRRR